MIGSELTLPSASTAYRLVRGDTKAVPNLIRDFLGRTALVGTGVKLAGASWKEAAIYGMAGSLSLEVFVLAYAAAKYAKERP